MKRRLEITSPDTSKKNKFLPILPNDIWKYITSLLDSSDYQTRGSLRSVSSFFAQDKDISSSYFHNAIRDNILDYVDESELNHWMPIPLNCEKYKTLIDKLDLKIKQFSAPLLILKEAAPHCKRLRDTLKNTLIANCQYGFIPIVQMFVNTTEFGISEFINEEKEDLEEEKMTALGYAAAYGRKKIFSILIQHGARFTIREIVPGNCQHLIFFDLGYYFKTPLTPLHILALRSNENWLMDILKQFPDLVSTLFTPYYKTCLELICKNNPEQLLTLLNADELLVQEQDVAGWTLLHWASCLDRIECMKVLMEKGVDVDGGYIPALYLACSTGKLSALQVLIANKAVVEPYINDSTCLHLTANNGHKDCTKYLIEECTLDVNEENDAGETPLTLALLDVDSENIKLSPLVKAKKAECAELLRSLGAKNNTHVRIL